MKRKRNEEIGQKMPDSQTEQKRHRNSADALGDQTRSDPLHLTSLVVDKILEHLDDRSLLTGRLVCRSWNAEITSRNSLWKQRCQRKSVFRFNLSATPLDDVFHQYVHFHRVYHRMRSGDAFHQYVHFHRVYHRMRSGDAFQVDKHSETLECFYGARDDNSLSQICGRWTFSEDWNDCLKEIFSSYNQIWVGKSAVVILTADFELVMADLKTQAVLWRQADVGVIFYDQFCPRTIYTVTLSGDIKLFSLEGKCDLHIHTGGKLIDAHLMFRHPNCDFLVVELDNDEVHLVDIDNKRVIKLQLVFPQIPGDDDDESEEDGDELEEDGDVGDESEKVGDKSEKEEVVGDEEDDESEEDDVGDEEVDESEGEEEQEARDPSLTMGFLLNDSLSREQLAIRLCRKYSVVVAIINTNGKILHQASRTYSRLLSWNESYLFNKLDNHIIVRTNEWITKYAIHCKPSGIQINLLWKKPFPGRLREYRAQPLMCGEQFILGQEGRNLLLFRLSDAQLVLSIPGFFRRRFNRPTNRWRLVDVSGESPELIARRIQILKADRCKPRAICQHLCVFLNNTSWLNGLSPATTKSDVPVLLYVSDADTGIKCLRWSADLWTGNDLQVQQQEQGKPETGLGLHAEIEHWNKTQWPPRGKKAD